MKLSILGHASLMLEDHNLRLITDPWLIGSCYWRSWWNEPYIEYKLGELRPTHIYISHLHWDHYHLPTLRKLINPETIFLIPKAISRRMRNDLKEFKNKVIELNHSKIFKITNKIDIISYQVNPFFLDSTLIIKSTYYTILNLNDSKPLGLIARDIKRLSGPITFMLRSYASASPIPLCVYENKNKPIFKKLDKTKFKEIYCQEFIDQVKIFKPKFAIPFASNHSYKRPDTIKFNAFATKMNFIRKYWDNCQNSKFKEATQLVCMENGSFYSTKTGFYLNNTSKKKDQTFKYIFDKKINIQLDIEKNALLNVKSAERYFYKFSESLNPIFRLLLPRYLVFKLRGKNEIYVLFQFNVAKLSLLNKNNLGKLEGKYLSINLPTKIFNDCNSKKMYNTLTPSKIVKFDISKCASYNLHAFLILIDMYENELIPFKKLFNPRDIKIILSRYRELYDFVVLFLKIVILKIFPKMKLKNNLVKL